MLLNAKNALIALSAVSGLAMLYVGAYQIRAIEHMSCPLLKHGCEAVADAPFARPLGIPDGFIAAAMYGLLILLALLGPQMVWVRYSLRSLAVLAALGMCWEYSIWRGSALTASIACSPRCSHPRCCGWRYWYRVIGLPVARSLRTPYDFSGVFLLPSGPPRLCCSGSLHHRFGLEGFL
jgi:hypothetical protein